MGPLPAGRAICYSGYRDGQSPDLGLYPDLRQIREDLALLAPHFRLLRLYDCTVHAQRVLQLIRQDRLPFRVLLGAWLAAEIDNPGCPWGGCHAPERLQANRGANDAEVERLIALARAYPDVVCAVTVGNEALVDWTDHRVAPERVLQLVRRVKAALPQPVTVCDNWVPWANGLDELAAALDFVSLHSYPVWEHCPPHEALARTRQDLARVAQRHPGKPLAITEAGWTTASHGRGIQPSQANEALQEGYLRELLAWSDADGVPCFLFEAFDEVWKGSEDPQEPEKHWGLYGADRRPKQAVRNGLLGA